MNQTITVLKHLYQFGSITSIEAIHLYGITRLSAVIYDIKKLDYSDFRIKTERIKIKNRLGHYSYPTKYILEPIENSQE